MNLGPWKSSMHLGDSATVDGAHAVHLEKRGAIQE